MTHIQSSEDIFVKVLVDEPFFGQREALCVNREKFILQIEQQLETLQNAFEWMTEELYFRLKKNTISAYETLCQKNVKIKYITAACCYNMIKGIDGIRQDQCNQKLMSLLNLKQRKLLQYLRMLESTGPVPEVQKLQNQLPHYLQKLRKFFYGSGQSILLTIRKSGTYAELIESILAENGVLILQLFQLQMVKQYCLSKKPSRLIINLGYCALQMQRINILYGDYARLFTVSINSLRYFMKGLLNIMCDLIHKLVAVQDDPEKTQSTMGLEICKEESSISDTSTDQQIQMRQISLVRHFLDDLQFLFIDTSEEDALFDEFDAL